MPGVVNIPAGVPFLQALAAGLLAEAEDRSDALADALVLLPTRRACRLFGEALLRQFGGRALLLPRIQPLGEPDADEVPGEGGFDLTLPPAIAPLRRQWLLARLFERSGWSDTHALRLAIDLAGLLDEIQTERVPLAALRRLVPDQLAEHWQKNHAVLSVIAEVWPEVLAAEGALDPAERYDELADIERTVADGTAAILDQLGLDESHRLAVAAGPAEAIAAEVQYAEAARDSDSRLALLRLDRERQARLEQALALTDDAAKTQAIAELDAWYEAGLGGIFATPAAPDQDL